MSFLNGLHPKSNFLAIIALWLACISFTSGKPTQSRIWKSTAGTSLEACATALEDGTVTLETGTGRVIKLKLDMLLEADRALLKEHFSDKKAAAPATAMEPPGSVLGPVKTEGSSYFYYVPKSLKPGRKAPLLFFTSSGNGSSGRLSVLREGAEICSWIIAISVECKNGLPDDAYITHTQRCINHLVATQPIDAKRIYFSGNSGGARVAFTNSVKFKGAGVLAIIAGAQPGEISRSRDYFFINGATDYNRVGSAISFKEAKSSAAFRFHPGSHAEGPGWLQTEGMVWLESRWHVRTKGSGPEREDFESAAMTWAESLKKDQDYRAAWWANYLATTGLSPKAKLRAELLAKELAAKPSSNSYINGIDLLEKFAMNVIVDGPAFAPDCFEYTSPAIQKGVDKILKDHAETPWIKEILEALKNKTGKG